jgi:hypothetical protein
MSARAYGYMCDGACLTERARVCLCMCASKLTSLSFLLSMSPLFFRKQCRGVLVRVCVCAIARLRLRDCVGL